MISCIDNFTAERYGNSEMMIAPLMYLPPAGLFALLQREKKIVFDKHEHFVKQTFRSRSAICGANGKMILSVPVEKRGNKIPVKDVKISYAQDWQKIHWRSIESSYHNSPYFEFYSDEMKPFYKKKYSLLMDLNIELFNALINLMKIQVDIDFTDEYIESYTNSLDLRMGDNVIPDINSYRQVFTDKHGFIPGLSIIDLLFNYGPETTKILRQ